MTQVSPTNFSNSTGDGTVTADGFIGPVTATSVTVTGGNVAVTSGNVAVTSGVITATNTSTSATPGTIRAIYGKYTTNSSGMTSGNLVGVRGEITLGGNASGTAYLYGVQGKLIGGNKTIDVGSSYAVGLFGQLDVSGTTVTSGYVAGVASDIFGVSSGTKAVDMFYGQHADGGTINSYFRAYGKATASFVIDTNGGASASATGTSTTESGRIKVIIDGDTRYIPLFTTAA